MCEIKVIAGLLIVITLAGLPCLGVQAEGGDDGMIALDLWRKRI